MDVSRRNLLQWAALLSGSAAATACGTEPGAEASEGSAGPATGGLYGEHQPGIIDADLPRIRMTAADLTGEPRAGLATALRAWTPLASQLMAEHRDDGLVVNVGLGRSLFGTAAATRHRPDALVDLPAFATDRLVPADSGGDLLLQVSAAEAGLVKEVSTRLLTAAGGAVRQRWSQEAANPAHREGETPRNILGFKDGTANPPAGSADPIVWASGAPDWMSGGTYLVIRRIRIDLDAWNGLGAPRQQQVIGRAKSNGAPLTGEQERDFADFSAQRPDGSLVIPRTAHMRVATASSNGGAQLLRRSFAFQNGPDDRGSLFMCYQSDPRQAFIPVQRHLDREDALSRFLTVTASAVFAIPPGAPGGGTLAGALLAG